MSASPDPAAQAVALVIQRRIADDGFAAFARWNGEVGEVIKAWPALLTATFGASGTSSGPAGSSIKKVAPTGVPLAAM